jgi:hypothetical protein
LFSFSVAQFPPATEPSMQIVDGKGSFFEQMYFAWEATGGVVGDGVGEDVKGGDVGGEVGEDVAGGDPGGSGREISMTVPSLSPCANFIGVPASAYDDSSEKPSELRQVEVDGTAVKVNEAVEPSEAISLTPPTVLLNPSGQARSMLRS